MKKDSQKKNTPKAQHSSTPFFDKAGEQSFFGQSNSTSTFSPLQAKLNIGTPDDQFEREADQMADQVVQNSAINPAPTAIQKKPIPNTHEDNLNRMEGDNNEGIQTMPLAAKVTPLVQRKKDHSENIQRDQEEEEEEELQLKTNLLKSKTPILQKKTDTTLPSSATQGFENKLKSRSNLGSPLSPSVQQEMEQGFGADFSGVRIHNDTEAAKLSNDINAQAFTLGNNIYFNKGKYNPSSKAGKHLLAHELTHTIQQRKSPSNPQRKHSKYKPSTQLAQQKNKPHTHIQRTIIQENEGEDGFINLRSNANSISGMANDGIAFARRFPIIESVMVYSQYGLQVYNMSGRSIAQFDDLEGEPTIEDGIWGLENGGMFKIGKRGQNFVAERRRLGTDIFSNDRQEIINERGFIAFPEDFAQTTIEHLQESGYLPAIIVFGQVPVSEDASDDGNRPLQQWATDQVTDVSNALGLNTNSNASNDNQTAINRDTDADQKKPDRLVPWVRQRDGEQFVNVWVGGQNRSDGGEVVPVQLQEGESLEDLQERIEQAAQQARQQLTERAINEEAEITGENVAINESTFTGGDSASGRTANRSAYRASMRGPEVMVRGGTGTYVMNLHYEDVYPDLLGQVSAAFNGSDYVWQIINITPLYQRLMQERSAEIERMRLQLSNNETPIPSDDTTSETELESLRQRSDLDTEEVSRFAADGRDFSRRVDNFTEDAEQAYNDLTNPIASQDGSPERAIRSVLVNTFNLSTLPLHGIMSLGGWMVRAFSSVFGSAPDYEREIPFPSDDGYYLVRCVAQPRIIGDEDDENAIIRMPSLATKVVEVKNIQDRTREELRAQDDNLQAMILELLISFRVATDETQLANIQRALALKVQEAAQSNRSFLERQIQEREEALGEEGIEEELITKINQELTILRAGTTQGAGLLSDIIERQLAIKRAEHAALADFDIYRRRDLERQIRQLERRVETANEREAEMGVGGTAIVRPQAVFVNEENGQTYPLLIEIGQSRPHSPTRGFTMRVSDITGSDSDQHSAIGQTQAEAVIHALEEYAGHFPYGRGYISVNFPSGLNFGIRDTIVRRCNPRDTAQASERLDELLQVLAVVGLFIPGVGVAAAAVGAAVSAARILSRVDNHTFAWDTNTITDILNIVGALASGVSRIAGGRLVRAQKLFAIVPESEDFAQWVTRLSRFNRAVDFLDQSVNHVSYLIGTMEIVNQYMEIQQQVVGGRMSHAEARRRRAQLLSQAMFDGFLQHAGDAIGRHRADGSEIRHGADDEGHHLPVHDNDAPPQHTEDIPIPHGEDTPSRPHEEDGRRRTNVPEPHTRPQEPSDPVSRLRAFLAITANIQALMNNDRPTLKRMIETFGNWRDLIMHLQSEPNNEFYGFLVDELGTYRSEIVHGLREQFGLELSDPNASTHASSDVDLAVGGTDAGRRLTDAEAFMREHYGPNWSEHFRMNFYTQAERLFIYEQVRSLMTDAELGTFQGRVTELAEILNFAKMLQHARTSSESTARVEALMGHLTPEQQATARSMAGESPGDASRRLAVLHSDIDTLHARFEALRASTNESIPQAAQGALPPTLPAHLRTAIESALTPQELQVALAQAITELQMRANFRTEEAYVSPGAGRQVVRGVAVRGHEAFQSALANLEMMEHTLRQAGGDVEVAIREYEMYKYIYRFIAAMQLSGVRVDSFMLAYYQAAYDIYRESRTSLQGVGQSDLSFLRAMHDQFLEQVAVALPQMREAATQNPTEWNPTHRSLEADDTHIRDLDRERGHTPSSNNGSAANSGSHGLTIGQLLADHAGISSIAHIPVRRNTSLDGNETRARFESGRLILELGPSAGHVDLINHLETLRVLRRYEGALGLVRRIGSRIGELLGWGPGFGSRGHEAQLEVDKLISIRGELSEQRNAIESAMQDQFDSHSLVILSQNLAEMNRQITAIEQQIRLHEIEVNSTATGVGHVAMEDTTAAPIIEHGDDRFRLQPGIGESWRYTDQGGTEGQVSRLTHDTLAISTELGQTTVRSNYQSFLRPGQVGLPSGRHGFEALHAIGPGVGHESPFGILMGPWRVNQLIQRLGIENFIATAGRNIIPGQQLFLRVEVERVTLPVPQNDGTVINVDFLKRITYQIYGTEIGPNNRLFSLELSVNEPNNPVSDVSFDRSAIELSTRIGAFTDVDAIAGILNPEFNRPDPIDE